MTPQDYKSDQYVRFCPGCGDHAICAALQKAMAQIGIPPHQIAVISGIGCSSRMPHYLNTYGFNTIHGRGGAVATGVKTSHPELTVWQMSGDGDCLAIGGNHFIHEIRRNVDLNVCMFNNRIYGLTKGQYSPTSPKGFVSKSSPFGTVERPFIPAELVLGARGTFFARTLDVDMPTTVDCMVQAHEHKGASIIECLVNCVIFNNGTHEWSNDERYNYIDSNAPHAVLFPSIEVTKEDLMDYLHIYDVNAIPDDLTFDENGYITFGSFKHLAINLPTTNVLVRMPKGIFEVKNLNLALIKDGEDE